uniref:TMV resistance protein N n=2 Tax=Quercus lobata TaxID=97700 RepID=A0A7N2M983_QUELO
MKSNDVRMVGIHGLGGVGKTTIAKAIYNKIANCFELSCFLEDVREKCGTYDGIIKLQEMLLSNISQGTYVKVDSVPKGIIMIKKRLCRTRLLLILDNVDESEMIVNLLGECNWFALGSRVIITTRDKQVLTTLGKDHQIYELKELNQSESPELFNLYAFQKIEPEKDYLEVAKQIIHYANGLPLALKIIGSDLCGKSVCEWKSALEKYKNISHEKIQEKLKISYDGLGKTEKDIFLDIACFFKGFNRSYVESILEACKLYPGYGIGKLIDKCLITVGQSGNLWMHDLLQQMGREIVQQESEELGKHSRVWCFEDAYEILTTNMGSSKIRGIKCYSPQPITMPIEAKAFEKMKYLKFLMVHNVRICEELTFLPNGLTLLQWLEFPFSLPSKYYPQQLVALEMPSSHIRLETTFKLGIQLKYLKYIDFNRCEFITELPELCAPNLEKMDLSYCQNLVKVHESVGFLDKLKIWKLQGCGKLQILPNNLRLKSLEEFLLIDCLRLEKFPNIDPEMKCLRQLYLRGTGIRELPSSIKYLTRLCNLDLNDCKNLSYLPDNIYKLQLLTILGIHTAKLRQTSDYLDGLSRIGFLMLDFLSFRGNKNIIELDFLMKPEYFPVLKDLDLSATNIVSIPESLGRFTTLEYLDIRRCKQLREIPRLPQSVQIVNVSNSCSLNPQSSSRLLNQIGEFLGIFPNKGCKGTRSRILTDPQTSSTEILDKVRHYRSVLPDMDSKPEDDEFIIRLPGTEIPKWLNLNHESDGNVISFWVGRTFPNIFDVCFAFGPVKYPWMSSCYVDLSINGCKKENLSSTPTSEFSDHLWIFSLSNNKMQNRLNKSNPSEQNYVEVTCEMEDWVKNRPRRWGVRVECICCSQKSNVFQLPSPSARHSCGSSSVPLLPTSSCGTDMDQWAFNNGGDSRHQPRRNHRPPPYARRPQKHYLSHFGWLRIRYRLWKRSSRPTRIQTTTLQSRALIRELEEIDPRSFNNGEEDSGLSMAHTFVDDCSNSKLCPPSKWTRKS